MQKESARILELALENLEAKKKQIEQEIAQITQELKLRLARRPGAAAAPRPAEAAGKRRRPRFSKEERERRRQRMKAYWEKWHKEHGRKK